MPTFRVFVGKIAIGRKCRFYWWENLNMGTQMQDTAHCSTCSFSFGVENLSQISILFIKNTLIDIGINRYKIYRREK
jgi:hypothetical protein